MKTSFKLAMISCVVASLMLASTMPVMASDAYVNVHQGDIFVYNYSMVYKNSTTSNGIGYVRVNAVNSNTTLSDIIWNQTVAIIYSDSIGSDITTSVQANVSSPISLAPFINTNIANKSLHQVANGTDCLATWDANGMLLSLNATMNASTPGLLASQVITRFERRSLISGYEPAILVMATILAMIAIAINLKRDFHRYTDDRVK